MEFISSSRRREHLRLPYLNSSNKYRMRLLHLRFQGLVFFFDCVSKLGNGLPKTRQKFLDVAHRNKALKLRTKSCEISGFKSSAVFCLAYVSIP